MMKDRLKQKAQSHQFSLSSNDSFQQKMFDSAPKEGILPRVRIQKREEQ